MWRRRPRRTTRKAVGPRIWTALITVDGYTQMPSARSETDDHDDQIMAAAHDAARLMRRTGADYGEIHLFRRVSSVEAELVEWRIVTFEERGLVVSENQKTEPYRDPIAPADGSGSTS